MVVQAAAVAGGYGYPDLVFPDYFMAPDAAKAEAEAEARGDEIEYDYSGMQWESPSDGSDPVADLALFASMNANTNLSLGDDDADWEPEPAPVFDDEGFFGDAEREWL